MKYGWSEEQLERVNARRARRGQMPLRQEYDKRKAEAEKPKRRFPETDEDETQVAKLGEVKTPRLAAGAEKTKEFQGRLMRERSQRGPMLIHRGGMAT